MLNVVVLLWIFFVFQDSLMNRNFGRTAFIFYHCCLVKLLFVDVVTVTFHCKNEFD